MVGTSRRNNSSRRRRAATRTMYSSFHRLASKTGRLRYIWPESGDTREVPAKSGSGEKARDLQRDDKAAKKTITGTSRTDTINGQETSIVAD